MKPFVLVVIATGTEEAVLTKIVDKEYPERVFISHGCSILEFKSCRVVMSRLRYMGIAAILHGSFSNDSYVQGQRLLFRLEFVQCCRMQPQ